MALFVQTMKLLIVFLLAAQALSQELNSTLHSTLYGVQIAYVDETVVFRCTVRGSNSMAWTSEEYIGTGGQRLEFSAAEPAGTRLSAVGNSQTVAVLVSARIDEIIVSELHIRIRPNYPSASVWCHNINAGTASSIEFLLADATLIDCDKQSACSGETVTCTCTTGNSTSLAWTSNDDRLTFASNDALGTRRNISDSSTFATLANSSNRNGITVITSNLTFVASNSMRFTCENIDRSISESTIIPISDFPIVTRIESCANINYTSTAGTSQVTTPADGDSNVDTCNRTGPIIAAVVVPIITIIIAIIVIIVAILCTYNQIKTLEKNLDDKIKEVTELTESEDQLKKDNKRQEATIDELNSDILKLKDDLSTMVPRKTLNSKIYELDEANRTINTLRNDMTRMKLENKQTKANSLTQSMRN